MSIRNGLFRCVPRELIEAFLDGLKLGTLCSLDLNWKNYLEHLINNRFLRKEAWLLPPKWNTRFFFAFSIRKKAKLNQDSQLGRLFFLPFQRNFSISFKPKIAIAKVVWKMQKKVWYYEKWVGRHASFPPGQSVKNQTSSEFIWKSWRIRKEVRLNSKTFWFLHSVHTS